MSCESGTFVAEACTRNTAPSHSLQPTRRRRTTTRAHSAGEVPRGGTDWLEDCLGELNRSNPQYVCQHACGHYDERRARARHPHAVGATRAPTAMARGAREPRRRHRGVQARCRPESCRTRTNGRYLSHTTSRPRPETVRAARWAPRRGGLCHHLVQRKSNFRLRLHRPYPFLKTEIHSADTSLSRISSVSVTASGRSCAGGDHRGRHPTRKRGSGDELPEVRLVAHR